MKVHFIAIGGSVMHNLALAMHLKGDTVSGSDDEIFEPARSRLLEHGILPDQEGWFPGRIAPDLDAVILGMHAKSDNPELVKAKTLNIPIYSFPEYLYEHAKEKKRIVIGGSHGKTTITAMIMHVLREMNLDFDYMVGAQLEGFDIMVRLSDSAPVMIFEGDEYLTSALDRRPKFHLYKPHIALLSGIAWDHMNVFPTWENYLDQFRKFIDIIEDQGFLTYCRDDKTLEKIIDEAGNEIEKVPYELPEYRIENGKTIIKAGEEEYEMNVFGIHNLFNISGALAVCRQLGVTDKDFFYSISTFKGAAKRLELLGEDDSTVIYKDFAHSPSKLKATVNAVKMQYPERRLVACMELHTYSSLNKDFLPEYKGCMDEADIAIAFYNPHALEIKKLPEINDKMIIQGFDNDKLIVYSKVEDLLNKLNQINWEDTNLLMMSSGDFGGTNLKELTNHILDTKKEKFL